MSVARDRIVEFLDRTLEVETVPDPYCPNGLQVEGSDEVRKVGIAVDACLQTFEALADCQMILTHHGLFWPAAKRITGPLRRSLGFLIERNISLYAVHLPLDVHAVYGNNAQILERLERPAAERFDQVGWLGTGAPVERGELHRRIEELLGAPARLLPFGPERVERLAVSSGGGSIGLLVSAQKAGADLLLTGEASHPLYHAAQEMGMNVILGGHYRTETWGVKALGDLLTTQFELETAYVDVPTGF